MTWLFALGIPGLLMLAAFGLDRIEVGLGRAVPDRSTPGAPAALPGRPAAAPGRPNTVFRPTRYADRV